MADDGEKREIVVGLPNNHNKFFKIRKPPKAAEGEEMNVKKKKKRKAAEGEEMNEKKKRRRRILKEKVDEGEKGNDDLPEEGEVKEGARRSMRTIKPNPKYLQ